eukprot:8193536-Pyramimonas_sp.AAC.1
MGPCAHVRDNRKLKRPAGTQRNRTSTASPSPQISLTGLTLAHRAPFYGLAHTSRIHKRMCVSWHKPAALAG